MIRTATARERMNRERYCGLMLSCTMRSFGDRFFYHPNNNTYEAPADYGLASERVSFHTADGVRLAGLFLQAEGQVNGTVLHLHGNAGNLTGHFPHVAWLPKAGWNVLCFDYRGYGNSQGKTTRAGTIADAEAALDYLLRRPDIDTSRIVALGQSLGGAVGIVLTAQRPEIRGLATDGAFDHYRRIACWHVRQDPLLFALAWWFPYLLMRDGYDPIDHVTRIRPRPLLIMQGTADRVVDPAAAQRLYDRAGEPKELWMIEGVEHYEALQEMADEVRPRLLNFFARCVV